MNQMRSVWSTRKTLIGLVGWRVQLRRSLTLATWLRVRDGRRALFLAHIRKIPRNDYDLGCLRTVAAAADACDDANGEGMASELGWAWSACSMRSSAAKPRFSRPAGKGR
jgi:hypothetical protein